MDINFIAEHVTSDYFGRHYEDGACFMVGYAGSKASFSVLIIY